MNIHTSLTLLICLLLASCASPLEKRMKRSPELMAKLSSEHRSAVLQGRVVEGMTRNAVYLAWGKPNRITTGRREGKAFERWSYTAYEPVFNRGPNMGWGFGMGMGMGMPMGCGARGGFGPGFFNSFYMNTGPTVDYVPYSARTVEFANDVVISYSMPR